MKIVVLFNQLIPNKTANQCNCISMCSFDKHVFIQNEENTTIFSPYHTLPAKFRKKQHYT